MIQEKKEKTQVRIRWMIRRDMPEVLQIEERSFDFAWGEEDFLHSLKQKNCIGMVADHGEKVVGFMIYDLHDASLRILNLAVHPGWRKMGVGGQLVKKMVSKLSNHRRTRVVINVRETNLPAQLFFRNQGFLAVRVQRGAFEDSGEDAYLMEYRHRR